MALITKFQNFAKKHIKIMKDHEVAAVCVDFDFDQPKIQEHLNFYLTDKKYQGLSDFEWNRTQTLEEKNRQRRRKLIMAIIKQKMALKLEKERRREEAELHEKMLAQQAKEEAEA